MVNRHDELEDLIGETRTTIEGLRVEAGKVEEFARAIGDNDPLYRDRAAARTRGFAGIPAPLTFTRTSRFPRYRTGEAIDLGFRHEDTLHGAQAYEYERLPVVGDRLRGETTFVDLTEREGKRGGAMTFAELETVYFDQDDERVLSERATVIETDGAVADDSGGSPTNDFQEGSATVGDSTQDDQDRDRPLDDGVSPDTPNERDATAPDPARAGDLAVGDRAPEVTIGPLCRQDFVRYAGASGDFNPIHYDEPYTQTAGNPSVFGQGMFTAGVAAHAIADWFGVGNLETFAVRFRSRVWPGDRIAAHAEVTDVGATTREGSDGSGGNDRTGVGTETRDGERVEADLWIERDGGETVLTGRATAVLEE
ncbi:dehydratase [Halobacteriales archaeon QS_3_64_16]|nr:MAG: dehydratase [Halobacteriales archaeon QS_3_64_16]